VCQNITHKKNKTNYLLKIKGDLVRSYFFFLLLLFAAVFFFAAFAAMTLGLKICY
jgi:hypothetical protein